MIVKGVISEQLPAIKANSRIPQTLTDHFKLSQQPMLTMLFTLSAYCPVSTDPTHFMATYIHKFDINFEYINFIRPIRNVFSSRVGPLRVAVPRVRARYEPTQCLSLESVTQFCRCTLLLSYPFIVRAFMMSVNMPFQRIICHGYPRICIWE